VLKNRKDKQPLETIQTSSMRTMAYAKTNKNVFIMRFPQEDQTSVALYHDTLHRLFMCSVWVRIMMLNATFNTISDISAVSFICGGTRSIRRKPPISRKSLTNYIT